MKFEGYQKTLLSFYHVPCRTTGEKLQKYQENLSWVRSHVGTMVRALAFNQCIYTTCKLSFLVLCLPSRGFPIGTPVFPSLPKSVFDLS